jgi:hypothetical protein
MEKYPFEGIDIDRHAMFSVLKKLSTNTKKSGNQDCTWFRNIESWKDVQNIIREKSEGEV